MCFVQRASTGAQASTYMYRYLAEQPPRAGRSAGGGAGLGRKSGRLLVYKWSETSTAAAAAALRGSGVKPFVLLDKSRAEGGVGGGSDDLGAGGGGVGVGCLLLDLLIFLLFLLLVLLLLLLLLLGLGLDLGLGRDDGPGAGRFLAAAGDGGGLGGTVPFQAAVCV